MASQADRRAGAEEHIILESEGRVAMHEAVEISRICSLCIPHLSPALSIFHLPHVVVMHICMLVAPTSCLAYRLLHRKCLLDI